MIAWAVANPGCRAVIDDLQGRRCAEANGVRLRGTVGLILRAKKQGRVQSARPLFERLQEVGMFLSRDLVNAVLAEVGE